MWRRNSNRAQYLKFHAIDIELYFINIVEHSYLANLNKNQRCIGADQFVFDKIIMSILNICYLYSLDIAIYICFIFEIYIAG